MLKNNFSGKCKKNKKKIGTNLYVNNIERFFFNIFKIHKKDFLAKFS